MSDKTGSRLHQLSGYFESTTMPFFFPATGPSDVQTIFTGFSEAVDDAVDCVSKNVETVQSLFPKVGRVASTSLRFLSKRHLILSPPGIALPTAGKGKRQAIVTHKSGPHVGLLMQNLPLMDGKNLHFALAPETRSLKAWMRTPAFSLMLPYGLESPMNFLNVRWKSPRTAVLQGGCDVRTVIHIILDITFEEILRGVRNCFEHGLPKARAQKMKVTRPNVVQYLFSTGPVIVQLYLSLLVLVLGVCLKISFGKMSIDYSIQLPTTQFDFERYPAGVVLWSGTQPVLWGTCDGEPAVVESIPKPRHNMFEWIPFTNAVPAGIRLDQHRLLAYGPSDITVTDKHARLFTSSSRELISDA